MWVVTFSFCSQRSWGEGDRSLSCAQNGIGTKTSNLILHKMKPTDLDEYLKATYISWMSISDPKLVPHELDGKLTFVKSGTLINIHIIGGFFLLFQKVSVTSLCLLFLSSQRLKNASRKRGNQSPARDKFQFFTLNTVFLFKKTAIVRHFV